MLIRTFSCSIRTVDVFPDDQILKFNFWYRRGPAPNNYKPVAALVKPIKILPRRDHQEIALRQLVGAVRYLISCHVSLTWYVFLIKQMLCKAESQSCIWKFASQAYFDYYKFQALSCTKGNKRKWKITAFKCRCYFLLLLLNFHASKCRLRPSNWDVCQRQESLCFTVKTMSKAFNNDIAFHTMKYQD